VVGSSLKWAVYSRVFVGMGMGRSGCWVMQAAKRHYEAWVAAAGAC
jgi:UDP-N-acetyl-D-mannosaminuronic acid transferase (WecB/TagA/CpsF family)